MNETLHGDLAAADPMSGLEDAKVDDFLRRMAFDAQRAATTKPSQHAPWWRHRRTAVPVGIAGVLALSAAAWVIPLSLTVNGSPAKLDAEIPINYSTDTGTDVSCQYGIYLGDPASRSADDMQLAKFVQEHNWTGIGQRIYNNAIANPFVPGPNDHWTVDTQMARDRASFARATDVVLHEALGDTRTGVNSTAGTTDCTGQLH